MSTQVKVGGVAFTTLEPFLAYDDRELERPEQSAKPPPFTEYVDANSAAQGSALGNDYTRKAEAPHNSRETGIMRRFGIIFVWSRRALLKHTI